MLNDFIVTNGKPKRILTDNGGEFNNKDFKNYCKKKGIELIHGKPRHPQTQGAVERYNRTIKDLRKTTFFEYEKKGLKFDIKNELIKSLNIYNSSKHTTTDYSPKYLFSCKNKEIYDKVIKNIIKSQFKRSYNNYKIIENQYGLLCEKFNLKGNTIKKNIFGGKGRYKISVIIIKNASSSECQIKLCFNYNNLKKDIVYYA